MRGRKRPITFKEIRGRATAIMHAFRQEHSAMSSLRRQDVQVWDATTRTMMELLGIFTRLCVNPTCGKEFTPVKRQIYCSSVCSGRVRTRLFRGKHRARFQAQRRAAYRRSRAA